MVLNSFTWSKAKDNGAGSLENPNGNFPSPQDFYNLDADYGDLRLRRALNNTTSFVWQLPFGSGPEVDERRQRRRRGPRPAAGRSAASTRCGPASRRRCGTRPPPSFEVSGINQDFRGSNNYRPNVVGDLYGDKNSVTSYLNQTNVVIPTDPSQPFGNAERNSVRGPWFWQVDFVASKDFTLPIGSQTNLQFRLEAFNLFNRTNFRAPNATAVRRRSARSRRPSTRVSSSSASSSCSIPCAGTRRERPSRRPLPRLQGHPTLSHAGARLGDCCGRRDGRAVALRAARDAKKMLIAHRAPRPTRRSTRLPRTRSRSNRAPISSSRTSPSRRTACSSPSTTLHSSAPRTSRRCSGSRYVEVTSGATPVTRRGYVNDFTLAEVKRLDAGSGLDGKFAGTRMLTFQEAIDLVSPGKGAGIYPELKDPEFYRQRGRQSRQAVRHIVKNNRLETDPKTPFVLQSFDDATLKAAASTCPRCRGCSWSARLDAARID